MMLVKPKRKGINYLRWKKPDLINRCMELELKLLEMYKDIKGTQLEFKWRQTMELDSLKIKNKEVKRMMFQMPIEEYEWIQENEIDLGKLVSAAIEHLKKHNNLN